MNIQKTNSFAPNFQSGMTFKLLKDFRNINVTKAEFEFAKMDVDADFRRNKSICGNFLYAANILSEIAGKYKLPFDILPPAIRVFKKEELIHKEENAAGLCLMDTRRVLKKQKPFVAGTIFMNQAGSGPITNDFISSVEYLFGWKSSPHFLSNTLHEWFHCIQNGLIFSKYGYEGKCQVLLKQYKKENACGIQKLDEMNDYFCYNVDKSLINAVGTYAAKSDSLLEMFAELMSGITTKSLDKNLNVIKNPLDNIPKDCPKFVKDMVEETLNI